MDAVRQQYDVGPGVGVDPQGRARETGVAFVSCGHHATERGGAAAVGAHLAAEFGLRHEFIDIDNPA
mgnify:CR=1 FL=1